MRVLIVASTSDTVGLLDALLHAETRSVATASSLAGAGARLSREPFDVVLTTTELPDGEGREVVPRLRSHVPSPPLVVLTGDPHLTREALRSGAQEVVDPVHTSREQLLRAIRHAIDRHAAARPDPTADDGATRQLLEGYTRAVAHDIQRPLATIQMLARAIASGRDHGLDPADLAGRIDAQAAQLQEFTDSLLADSVGDTSTVHDVQLAPLVTRALDLYAGRLDAELLSIEIPEDLHVAGRDGQLLRALLNLLGNVTQHAGPHPTVAITARDENGEVLLTVDDDGPGVPREDQQRILAPGTRLDSRTRGHGLGLAAVDLVARAHGGRVLVDDSPLGGLRVGLALPRAAPRDAADSPRTGVRRGGVA